jgi:GntR family transcriptional regulator
MKQRRSSTPLRYQIRRTVLDFLAKGEYQSGDRIPTEEVLMKTLEVSRSSLREGLHLLEQEGILRTRHGIGRFLMADPNSSSFDITELTGHVDLLARTGLEASLEILEVKGYPSKETAARYLEIEPGDRVVRVERLCAAQGIPIIYSIDILPERLLHGGWVARQFEGPLAQVLAEGWNIHLDHAHTWITAHLLDEKINHRISADPQIPWILLEQTTRDTRDEPVLYSRNYYRTDFIRFSILRYRR